jgi:hypothetical protein
MDIRKLSIALELILGMTIVVLVMAYTNGKIGGPYIGDLPSVFSAMFLGGLPLLAAYVSRKGYWRRGLYGTVIAYGGVLVSILVIAFSVSSGLVAAFILIGGAIVSVAIGYLIVLSAFVSILRERLDF